MVTIDRLRELVTKKSGAPPLVSEPERISSLLGLNKEQMTADGYDPTTIAQVDKFHRELIGFIRHPEIGDYLTSLTPVESFEVSGIFISTLEQIVKGAFHQGSPDGDLFSEGYLAFAGDAGGNSVCFNRPSGSVVFAHHERSPGESVHVLSKEIPAFLEDLLSDRLTQQLDELD